jgi:outer membrane protein OmpA-like peptidoglycan-associated protein
MKFLFNQPFSIKTLFCISFFFQLQYIYSHQVNKDFIKAESNYNEQNYDKAIKYFLKVLEAHPDDSIALLRIARCFEKLGQYPDAEKYYSKLIIQSNKTNPNLFLEYGQLLLKIGRHEDARDLFTSYNNLRESNDLMISQDPYCIEDKEKFYRDSSFYFLEEIDINSFSDIYKNLYFNNILFFESKTVLIDGFSVVHNKNEVYLSKINSHSGIIVHSLYHSYIDTVNETIIKEEMLNFDSFEYNIFYPAISPSGNKLVFVSDAVNGIGGLDLYVCTKNNEGFTTPRLISGSVNTLDDESYPYLLNDSILFYSSNTKGGLGGYDIFLINLDNPASLPINMGYPLNTRFDEKGICFSSNNKFGFISSNRTDSIHSNIFEFQILKTKALGEVVDEINGMDLKNVQIVINHSDTLVSNQILSDNGHFSFTGFPDEVYYLTINKNGYKSKTFNLSIHSNSLLGFNEVNIGVFKIEKDTINGPPEISNKLILEKDRVISTSHDNLVKTDTSNFNNYPSENAIFFRVQIAASRKKISNAILHNIYIGKNNIVEYYEDNWFKYSIGDFDSYYEANLLRKHCCVKDAFIAAYSGKYKYELMSAIKEVNARVLDLQNESEKLLERHSIISKQEIYYTLDNFMPNKTELLKINDLKDSLILDNSLKIEIDGHTDILGSTDYNIGLSIQRAKFIKDYLMNNSIEDDRILILGYGKSRLKVNCYNNCDSEIHKENRRVEIIVFK